jgi:hypothetical protein
MAKGRSGQGREVKKPKADKKPVPAASTFLRPQPPSPKAKQPDGTK